MAKEKNSINYKKIKETISKNYWTIATLVLAVILIVVLVSSSSKTVSAEEAGQNVLIFAREQGVVNPELISASDSGSLYEIVISIDGQEVPLYVTKDGKTLVPQPISIEPKKAAPVTTKATSGSDGSIPKSDKPVVELFIWSYCPYGVQAQGPMAEVASLLGNYADFKIVPYYDGHGAYETQQNKIQSCIQKLESDKYWDYAAGFVENIYQECGSSRDIVCDKTKSIELMNSLGIDSSAVMSCVDSDGDALLTTARQNAQANGVTGSPTVLINGVKANVARTAESFKTAICSAFNEAPAECSSTLDSTAGTASGSC